MADISIRAVDQSNKRILLCTGPRHPQPDLYCISSQKQQHGGKHFTQFGYIILTSSQIIIPLSHYIPRAWRRRNDCQCKSLRCALTRIEPMTSRTRGEQPPKRFFRKKINPGWCKTIRHVYSMYSTSSSYRVHLPPIKYKTNIKIKK